MSCESLGAGGGFRDERRVGLCQEFLPKFISGFRGKCWGYKIQPRCSGSQPGRAGVCKSGFGPQSRKTAKDTHNCKHPGQEGGTTGLEVADPGAFAGAGLRGCVLPVCRLEGRWHPLAWAAVSKFLSPSPHHSRPRIDGQGLPGFQKAGRKEPNFDRR